MKNLGVDIGSYYTKTSNNICFTSKVAESNTNAYENFEDFDTEYRKAYRKGYLLLLERAIKESTLDKDVRIVTGLPLTQYQADKDYLTNRIISSGIVKDVEVVPEGVLCMKNEGILVDIGGRTTDICVVLNEDNIRKIKLPYSLPKGMLNVEENFINSINSEYGLNLELEDSNRILKNGLFIDGESKKISFNSFQNYVNKVISELQLNYPLKTHRLYLTGGGSIRLYNIFKSKIKETYIVDNAFFANAYAFYRYGRSIWNV